MADEPKPPIVLRNCPFCGEQPSGFGHDGLEGRYIGKWGWVNCCWGPAVHTDREPVEHWAPDAPAAWNQRAGDA